MSGGENPNAATSVSTRPREGKKRRRKSLPFSQVRKCRAQAARVLSKLLLAAREKRHGTSIKSLTLDARKIDFPSATHAIVCETVKVLPLLKVLINDVKMTENVVGDDENDVDDDGDEKEEEEEEEEEEDDWRRRERKEPPKTVKIKESVAYVLLYELLLSPGKSIKPPNTEGDERERESTVMLTPAEKLIISKTGELKNQLYRRLRKANAQTALEFVERRLPEKVRKIVNDDPMSRFARVNGMKVRDVDALAKELRERGFTFEKEDAHLGRGGGGENEGGCCYISFAKDCDRKKLSGMKMVKNGELILQGKSSCMPAHCLLVNEEGKCDGGADMSAIFERIRQSDVIDACAAPGNKTTHLVALLDNNNTTNNNKDKNKGGRGKVFAFEKDHKRAQRLRDTVDLYGCSKKVIVAKKNFLEVDVNDAKYRNVRSILLDPSCSGSGTVQNRGDALMEYALKDGYDSDNGEGEENDLEEEQTRKKRVMSLQKFQIDALSHAMRFPGVLRISYSTCSIYQEENEDVVKKVIPLAKELGFELAKCLPKWPRRGFTEVLGKTNAAKVVRVNPFEGDDCEGFFVAVFQRKKEVCEKIIDAFEKEEEIQKSKKKNKRDLESDVLVVPVFDTENAKKKKKKNGGSKMPLFR